MSLPEELAFVTTDALDVPTYFITNVSLAIIGRRFSGIPIPNILPQPSAGSQEIIPVSVSISIAPEALSFRSVIAGVSFAAT